ncbi:hypothetical protein PISMIDRAFT_683566 [Pisolithus microcarpus 441]|uniref:Uncharacterized protein n=1 Tax=Pisolithus microcarpus 441 TaxID=765257 RepID=A0A0C9YR12_9AGAM|nr:hypothetical protein PISMIDRAFT_683566 [Pisolithus microcarpus 441]
MTRKSDNRATHVTTNLCTLSPDPVELASFRFRIWLSGCPPNSNVEYMRKATLCTSSFYSVDFMGSGNQLLKHPGLRALPFTMLQFCRRTGSNLTQMF